MTRLATSRSAPVLCASCGRTTERAARNQVYCSPRCREKGKERSRKALLTRCTGAPPPPQKLESKINSLQGRISGSSPPKIHARGWQAPSRVIDAHFPAGVETVSAGGVVSFVARLSRPALVSGGAR